MAVLPVYNTLLLPNATLYMKTERFLKRIGRAPRADEKVSLIVFKNSDGHASPAADDFYPIGVIGSVSEVHDEGWFAIRTRGRVNLDEISVLPDGRIEVFASRRSDAEEADPERSAQRLAGIRDAMNAFGKEAGWSGTDVWTAQFASLADVACAVGPWMNLSNEERYRILAEDSAEAREVMLEKVLYETMEMTRLSHEGSTARQEDYQKMVRESAIKKQMEYLQKELDELHPENVSDLRRLEMKIADCGMNSTARKEAEKLLKRLRQEGQNGAETGMLYNYLDFLTGLPWARESAQRIDLDRAGAVLEEDHFGLRKVKNRILGEIAVMNLRKKQSGSILLFVGAPGTGKTSIGQSIARALERKYVRVSLGGVRDEADIRGHRRTYIGAMPGRIMDAISKCGASNPVMVLDEVDKLSQSINGDPASALLEVLDPEQNRTFTDHYMNVPYDLSDVLFICTANTVETIPEPLLNRMEVIEFRGYTPLEKMEIARRHLLPKSMEAVGLTPEQLIVTDAAIERIIDDYTREGGVRGLKKRMDALGRAAAVHVVRGGEVPLTVTEANLKALLEARPMRRRMSADQPAPGIVTGLAWTPAGGDILFIEALLSRGGKGSVTVTGQLGDVMKESVQLAVSLVRHRFPECASQLREGDLHIHVPDGATPKDGPSAGVTLTTALASLLTGRPVDGRIAMTGEIMLSGEVGPIGGLPEKLMAAQRSGIEKVFIPAENQPDLEDVPEEVRRSLTIVPVRRMDEILEGCGILNSGVVAFAG